MKTDKAQLIPKFMNKLFIILPLIIAVSLLVLPLGIFYDSHVIRVFSTSMLPTLQPNDLILVEDIEFTDVKIGQIIVFQLGYDDSDLLVHRAVAIGDDDQGKLGIDTKGDNVEISDYWTVYEENFIGVVVDVIPFIGIFMINSVKYLLVSVIILMSFLLLREYKKQEKLKNT